MFLFHVVTDRSLTGERRGKPQQPGTAFRAPRGPGVVQLVLSLSWAVAVSGTETVYQLCVSEAHSKCSVKVRELDSPKGSPPPFYLES